MKALTSGRPGCYIVIGNHDSHVGITENLFAITTYFSRHYQTFVTESLVPGELNVLIDEFSRLATVEVVRQTKEMYPNTRLVLMATEFVTRTVMAGIDLGNTFNFFHPIDDRRYLARLIAHRFGACRMPPYLQSRYEGFVQVLPQIDLILCAHDAVSDTLHLLPPDVVRPRREPLTLHPEIDVNHVANDERLYLRPAGVTMTGTLTSYRKGVAAQLSKAFQKAHIQPPFYRHIPFKEAPGLRIGADGVDFGYSPTREERQAIDARGGAGLGYLFNLNPPQRANWAYSSPMRILRAIMLGQIPMLTRKFGDHEIEATAVVFDGSSATAEALWADATINRNATINRYLSSIKSYNQVAREKNARIDAILPELTVS